MFEATCPGCGVTASPYDARCPTCSASLRVPCRDCSSLVHVADSACYCCGAVWPADGSARAGLTPVAIATPDPTAVPEPTIGPVAAPAWPAEAHRDEPSDDRAARSRRRLAPLASFTLAAVVVASGAVFVASSRGDGPGGGVSSAAASPTATTLSAAATPAGAPTDADAERDRLTAELQYGLALPEPEARCLADTARATLGDDAFVSAHRALTGGSPDAGHAVLDPALEAARPPCGLPASSGG